jgi:hypothetical protein
LPPPAMRRSSSSRRRLHQRCSRFLRSER